MTMITRCPACDTAFRVYPDQLDARDGRVRCGRCAVVFDARVSLAAAPDDPTPPEPVDAENLVLEAVPDLKHAPARERLEGPQSAPPSQPPYSEVAFRAHGAPTLPPQTEDEVSYSEVDEDFDFGPRRRRRAVLAATLWGLAGLALVLALVGQAAYHYRSDLAAQVPELRGTLDRACEQLGCDVPLPTRAKLVTIESSEMQPDAGAPGVLALSAVLRNRAGFAQKQPWIELTLTDAQDRALARRVLAPRDYLGQRAEFEPTFAAGAEQSLRLLLDVEGLQARGYRLLVFYP